MTSAPAIGFEYRPSRQVARLLVIIGTLALVAVALCGLPSWVQALLGLMVVVACVQAVRRLQLPVMAAGWSSAGGWTLRGVDGTDDPATLRSFKVMRSCVLLRLSSARHGRLTFWLMPDNIDADSRRRVRMRVAVMKEPV